MKKNYVVVTCWVPADSSKRTIQHAYGPFTKARAESDRRETLRDLQDEPGTLYVSVCKIIDIAAMNGASDADL